MHWEPVRVERLLFLEGPLEGVQDGPHGEGADGGPRDGIRGRREHGVDDLVALPAIDARDDVRRRLCQGKWNSSVTDPTHLSPAILIITTTTTATGLGSTTHGSHRSRRDTPQGLSS